MGRKKHPPVELDCNRFYLMAISGGPSGLAALASSDPHPFAIAVLEAAESAGLQRFENSSGRMMEAEGGCALVDEIVHEGRRQVSVPIPIH